MCTFIMCTNYIYTYIVIILFRWSTFIPSRNLDEVFTYNHMALIFLRSRSHVKASMVLTRADNLFIHNYIISLLNIILRPILIVRTGHEPASYCLFVWRISQLTHTGSLYIYIYIYYTLDIPTSSGCDSLRRDRRYFKYSIWWRWY